MSAADEHDGRTFFIIAAATAAIGVAALLYLIGPPRGKHRIVADPRVVDRALRAAEEAEADVALAERFDRYAG